MPDSIKIILLVAVIMLVFGAGAYIAIREPAERISAQIDGVIQGLHGGTPPEVQVTVPIPERLIAVFERIEIILWVILGVCVLIAFAGLLDLMKYWTVLKRHLKGRVRGGRYGAREKHAKSV